MTPFYLSNHVALVTGGNHGIGAATARVLAECGARVLVTYLRLDDEYDAGIPETYRRNRASDAEHVLAAIRAEDGRAIAVEADLADATTPRGLFDIAEAELGPVDVLVNNATGWLSDTFRTDTRDRHGRRLRRVSAETFEQQFAVDAGGTATLISEFARRHVERGARWGRIIGLTSGGPERLSRRGLLRGGQGSPRELHHGGGVRAGRPRDHRERSVSPSDQHGMGDGRGATPRRGEHRPYAHRRNLKRSPVSLLTWPQTTHGSSQAT